MMNYVEDLLNYQRRRTREVKVGHVGIGGENPMVVQSMLTSDTLDTAACVEETLGLVEVGCEIVRVTAQTKRHAANLENIRDELRKRGCDVPLVADIHFKPDAALEAAKWVEKVRVNPGNFVDKKKFEVKEYTDDLYNEEVERVREKFSPLVKFCKEHGVAMRIGTNHGSLSDRIMNRWGDTPAGMVESALEFARIARELDYHNFLFSMKASNPKVMIQAYRLLVARLEEAGPDWNYPLHLGVTEAGDGEDGRIKSAIGIGSLLADGLGDTVRVSLTEDSVHEIPVAQALVEPYNRRFAEIGFDKQERLKVPNFQPSFDPFDYRRRESTKITFGSPVSARNRLPETVLGGDEELKVLITRDKLRQLAHKLEKLGDFTPDANLDAGELVEVDPRDEEEMASLNGCEPDDVALITVRDGLDIPVIPAFRLLAARADKRWPILLKDTLEPSRDAHADFQRTLLNASTRIGALICDGIGDAILIQGEQAPGQSLRLAFNILQAAGARLFKTDYVACPSCGRTLFNLQETTARIRAATGHLKGVRIAVMGCIVNGPGEMADADFGYVGGAPGKINLYVGKTPVKFNIPAEEAVDRLKDLIAEHGKWVDPPARSDSEEEAEEEPAAAS